MKVISIFWITAMLLLSCSVSPDVILQEEEIDEGSYKKPQTVFEGKWTWLKTEGIGIAGPYKSDSVSTGYSLHYEFGFYELQTFINSEERAYYTYSFTVSEKPEEQVLTLIDEEGSSESFLWEILTDNDNTILILRNTQPCCDNTFEKHFRLIARPDLGMSK